MQNIRELIGKDDREALEKLAREIFSGQTGTKPGTGILKNIFSLLDLTSLGGSDTGRDIADLCRKACSFKEKGMTGPAAVCVYPVFIRQVRDLISGTGIRVAAVAGGFPSGQTALRVKLDEVWYAVDEGAEEIDMVISRGRFLEGDTAYVREEITKIRELTKGLCLKVILETGELKNLYTVFNASELAIIAGADFIKTSTGKISPAATIPAVMTMCHAIREHYNKTGKKVGIKPAGGISEPKQALEYFLIVKEMLGPEWLTPGLFRIGASRLADNLAMIIDQ